MKTIKKINKNKKFISNIMIKEILKNNNKAKNNKVHNNKDNKKENKDIIREKNE